MPNITRLATQVTISVLKRLLARLEPGDRSWLARHVVLARERPEVCALVDFCYGAIRGWKNSEFDIATNGEAALLQRLSQFSPHTVIDVGANRGDWSLAALQCLPDATVHAFEIAPATFEKLRKMTQNYDDRLIINKLGLSDVNGNAKLYYTPESDTASSLISESIKVSAEFHRLSKMEELSDVRGYPEAMTI